MITLSIDGNVATITLGRAPVNAINAEWLDHLGAALDKIEADKNVGVILIRSSERLFCAGADLKLMRSWFENPDGGDTMIAFVRRIQENYARIENMSAVSIAEIAGAAMGGGLELALSCDFRVIADNAKVGLPEARLGLLPGAGGTQRMPQRCGDAAARRLILGAEIVDGKTAHELNIAHWCVAGDEIETFTRDLAARIGALPAHALAACKTCIAASYDESQNGFEVELSGTRGLFSSTETQDLVSQFLKGIK